MDARVYPRLDFPPAVIPAGAGIPSAIPSTRSNRSRRLACGLSRVSFGHPQYPIQQIPTFGLRPQSGFLRLSRYPIQQIPTFGLRPQSGFLRPSPVPDPTDPDVRPAASVGIPSAIPSTRSNRSRRSACGLSRDSFGNPRYPIQQIPTFGLRPQSGFLRLSLYPIQQIPTFGLRPQSGFLRLSLCTRSNRSRRLACGLSRDSFGYAFS